MRSGLGDVEQKAVEDWEKLAAEEKERLVSFRRFLAERRPADVLPTSPLGILESFIVKLINGPRLVRKTLDRVQELLSSSTFDEKENAILQRRFKEIQEKDCQGAMDDDFGRDMDTDERIRPWLSVETWECVAINAKWKTRALLLLKQFVLFTTSLVRSNSMTTETFLIDCAHPMETKQYE